MMGSSKPGASVRRSVGALIAAVTLVALIGWKPSPSVQRTDACRPSTDGTMRGLAAEARHLVVTPKLEQMRGILHVPAMDSALVRPIQSDSLCRKAVQTINRERGGIDSSRTIYLVQIGPVYWAEDPTIQAGEDVKTFIMDSALTTILSRPLR
jgi:hypothetical protein